MFVISIGSNTNHSTSSERQDKSRWSRRTVNYSAARASSPDAVSIPSSTARRVSLRLLSLLSAACVFFLLLFATIIQIKAEGAVPAAPAVGESTIIVSSGDTLWSIAKNSSLHGAIQERIYMIKERNNLSDSRLLPGQELVIPSID